MPLFEYQCSQCGHITTFLEKAAASSTHRCERCGSTHVKKQLSSFAVQDGGRSGAGASACPTGRCPFEARR